MLSLHLQQQKEQKTTASRDSAEDRKKKGARSNGRRCDITLPEIQAPVAPVVRSPLITRKAKTGRRKKRETAPLKGANEKKNKEDKDILSTVAPTRMDLKYCQRRAL